MGLYGQWHVSQMWGLDWGHRASAGSEEMLGSTGSSASSAPCRSRQGLVHPRLKDVTNFNEAEGNLGQCWMC